MDSLKAISAKAPGELLGTLWEADYCQALASKETTAFNIEQRELSESNDEQAQEQMQPNKPE